MNLNDGATYTLTPAVGTGNPLAEAVQFADNAWGFETGTWGFIFGIVIVGMTSIGFGRIPAGQPLVTAIGALLGVGLSVLLGVFPVWVLFIVGLLIIAFASTLLFSRNDETGG